MRSHSSSLFEIGQSLLVNFGLCAPTRLVFLTLVSHCWWTGALRLSQHVHIVNITSVHLLIAPIGDVTASTTCPHCHLKKTRHCYTQLEENKTHNTDYL